MYWSGMEQNNGIVDNSFSERHKKTLKWCETLTVGDK